jgi:hypothetical protein
VGRRVDKKFKKSRQRFWHFSLINASATSIVKLQLNGLEKMFRPNFSALNPYIKYNKTLAGFDDYNNINGCECFMNHICRESFI